MLKWSENVTTYHTSAEKAPKVFCKMSGRCIPHNVKWRPYLPAQLQTVNEDNWDYQLEFLYCGTLNGAKQYLKKC
jgi:hypothetical protein